MRQSKVFKTRNGNLLINLNPSMVIYIMKGGERLYEKQESNVDCNLNNSH